MSQTLRKGSLAALLLLIIPQAFAQPPQRKECTFEACKAGTAALTHFTKSDPYYSCPMREFASYLATVMGLMAIQVTVTGQMPNISDKTGEPEYTGETKAMVDAARTQAQVRSFDDAIKMCSAGSDKRRVTVLNMPEGSLVAYVLDEGPQEGRLDALRLFGQGFPYALMENRFDFG
jgi:hypothetical protein